MLLIAQLKEQHLQLRRDAAEFLRVVDGAVADPATVAALRWRLVRSVVEHCELEDRWVYDRLLASDDAPAIEAAQRVRHINTMLRQAVRRFVTEWPVDRIAPEWTRFQLETRTLFAELAESICEEEAGIYRHAERLLTRRAA